MKIQEKYHSKHIEALKQEIKQKFKHELSAAEGDSYLKRKTKEALACLDSAIVSVDILRSADFNPRLDSTKNFYGMKLDVGTANAHLIARKEIIRHSLQMSMQMMNKKDMWKFFLSSTLMELQKGLRPDIMLRVGSDHKFPTDKDSKDTADFIVAGPRPTLDFPLLIVDICTDDEPKGKNARGSNDPFNPAKLQNMMSTTLVDFFNTRKHWPLTELVHFCVYGIIIHNDEFYISKMALRPEIGTKLAFVYTRGKRLLPRNIFTKPKTTANFNQEAWAQARRGDEDSIDDEDYSSSEEEWVICHMCQTCHYRGERHHFEEEFECLTMNESPKKPEADAVPQRTNGAKVYRRPHGGSVTAIIALMQTVIVQSEYMKAKDRQFKNRKITKYDEELFI